MNASAALQTADWRARAACRDKDPDLFFPVGTTGPAEVQIAEAKLVCAGCAVRRNCGEFALATFQKHGIWGGIGEDERHLELRRRRRRRREYAA
jgi:WhiB family redox-sensing transcriptional regulator